MPVFKNISIREEFRQFGSLIAKFTMSENFEYIITRPGIFKLITIVLGIVCVGLSSYAHFESGYEGSIFMRGREEFLIGLSITVLVISILYLIIHSINDDLAINNANKMIDAVYHFIVTLLLLVAGSLMIYNAVEIDRLFCRVSGYGFGGGGGYNYRFNSNFPFNYYHHRDPCRSAFKYEEKLSSGIIGIINGIMYSITAIFVLTSQT